MALRFPHVDDIPLRQAPLTNVLCQVRFPAILSITRGHPIDFQEAIRQRFPELESEQDIDLRVDADSEQGGNVDLNIRAFQFLTADRSSMASLTVDFYALSTGAYTVWDEFAKDLGIVSNAASAAYALPYAHRVGLRYLNQFDFEKTGCTTIEELCDLLRPELVALFGTPGLEGPQQAVSMVTVAEEGVSLTLRVAMRPSSDSLGPALYLDLDCFEEGQVPLEGLLDRCRQYHDFAYRAFRWALAPDSLERFSPLVSTGR